MGRVYGDIDKKAVLLKSTVTVVAQVGIENASTRLIGKEAGFQDAFIYRYFNDKTICCRRHTSTKTKN